MKRTLLLFLSLLLFITSEAQIKKRYNRSFFGLNIGATYQQSDVRDIAHAGWGFTFGKYYHQNETNMFDFGWRLRYLGGNTSGLDKNRNTNIGNNSVLTNLNYDSIGYVYNNYKMRLDEGAFEIMIGLNRLREKTRIVFYGFGGIGLSGWQTKINQLDGKEKMYSYDSLGVSPSLATLEALLDDSYETNADGNDKYKAHFVPSVGLGLGWQTKRGHYIGFEHRMTFAMNDYTDGVTQTGGGFLGINNDLYHYTGFFVRWMIGGGTSTYNPSDPNGYSNNPPPPPTYTTTVVNPPPPPHYDNPPPPPPGNKKPVVIINYPNTNPYKTSNSLMTVTASVLNVGSRNDITVKVNGFPSQNFAYDMSTKALTVTSQLNSGNNSFYISAVNPYGNDYKSTNVIYEQGNGNPPQQPKPIITVSYPLQNPFITNQNNITLTGTVMNVNSKSDITAYVNNIPNGTFTYDANSKVISLKTNLNLGSNTIKFNATNTVGSDSKTQTIIYQTAPPPSTKPIVTITSPSPSPYHTNVPSQIVYATVQNVNSQNEISVVANGASSVFSYDANTKNLMVSNNNLNIGNNIFTITASNANGQDSKSVTVVYANKQGGEKPQVIITNPPSNPFNTKVSTQTINATVLNLASKQEISVKVNNQSFNNFSYSSSSKSLTLTSNLNEGNNMFTITVNNQNGNDSKSVTVIYTKKIILPKPVVTITYPTSNPFTTNSQNITITATVLNISSKSDITVTTMGNTAVTNFTYDANTKKLSFSPTLMPSTPFTITATNPQGSDSKSITIKYVKLEGTGEINPVKGEGAIIAKKPVVTITNPSTNPAQVASPAVNFTATVLNVSSQNDIKITLNGDPFTNFTYSANTKIVSFTANMHWGTDNIVTVTATNSAGSDSKSMTVKAY